MPINEPTVGDWVVVEYDGQTYPGLVTDRHVDTKEVRVNCMVAARCSGLYRWPEFGRDEIWYSETKVVRKIQAATPTTNRGDVFRFENLKRKLHLYMYVVWQSFCKN